MGKKATSSWFTAVKKAFRSPTKDTEKKSSRRREHEQEEEEEKQCVHTGESVQKREKRRWLFRKPMNNVQHHHEVKTTTTCVPPASPSLPAEQRHAIAVAAATAEAAAATAQAAVEIIRLTRSSNHSNPSRQHCAAIVIQTTFRGYLARRALVALRGIVKLQALIRGQNIRKQAKMTLRCMQALLRVQARVRDQRARISHDGGARKSMFAETTNLWDYGHLQEIRERKSTSRDTSCNIADEWNDCPRTIEELEAILHARKEAVLKRERSQLSCAFYKQASECDPSPFVWHGKETDERRNWLDKWMATKQWGNGASIDKRDAIIRTVEIDTQNPCPYAANDARKLQEQSPYHKQAIPVHAAASPHNRSLSMVQPPMTPSPSSYKTKPLHLRSGSPRRLKEEKCHSTANTPSLQSFHRLNSSFCRYNACVNYEGAGCATIPNYMAATESAKAKTRSQSAPRQRPSTPEREQRGGSAKKRLSYPAPETYSAASRFSFSQNLRSPSFKSVQAGYVGMEQQSNNSCYTDSIGGEISPCSTTDLRRWLR